MLLKVLQQHFLAKMSIMLLKVVLISASEYEFVNATIRIKAT